MKTEKTTKTKWHEWLMLLLMVAMPSLIFAQETQISGKIIDSKTNLPIEGVSIAVKNSRIGTISDQKGEYTLVTTLGVEVNFSFLGYETQSLLANQTVLNISLVPSAIQLKDFVITALGVKKEKNISVMLPRKFKVKI